MNDEMKLLCYNGILLCVNKAGGRKKLADDLKKPRTTISTWLSRDRKMPALAAIKSEKLYNIPREIIRPDIDW